MLTAVKWTMRGCALFIVVCIALALQGIMPSMPLLRSLFYFTGLCVAFMFAVTLVVSSLFIGNAPGRSRLGESLSSKVDQQTGGARAKYDETRRNAASNQTSRAQTTVPAQAVKLSSPDAPVHE